LKSYFSGLVKFCHKKQHIAPKSHTFVSQNKGCVTFVALPFTLKKYLKAKEEELWRFKYFTMQKYNLQKTFSTRNQNSSRYHNSITNLKLQHEPKYIIFQKSSYKKENSYYLVGAKIP
jgi:hypothetical protein